MIEWLLPAALGLVGTASGWIAAWRSRTATLEAKDIANAHAERARVAEVRADAERNKALLNHAGQVTAETQLRVILTEQAGLRVALQREQADKGALLEQLAKMGAPVGDALLDSTLKRLYADRDRRAASGSQGPGSSRGKIHLPAPVAGATTATGKKP